LHSQRDCPELQAQPKLQPQGGGAVEFCDAAGGVRHPQVQFAPEQSMQSQEKFIFGFMASSVGNGRGD
jgi:hypothetical protein